MLVLFIVTVEVIAGVFGILNYTRGIKKDFSDSITAVFSDENRVVLQETANEVAIEPVPENTDREIVINERNSDNAGKLRQIIMQDADKLGVGTATELYILSGDGGVLFASNSAEQLRATSIISGAIEGREGYSDAYFTDNMEFALPITVNGRVGYIVYLRRALSDAHATVRRFIAVLVITLICSAAAMYLLSLVLLRTITKPLKELANQALRLANGDRVSLEKTESPDEIGELSNALLYLSQSRNEHADRSYAEKSKVEKILENMNDGILAFDMKGNLIHINPEAKRVLNRKFVDDIKFNKFFKEINADITLEQLQYDSDDSSIERVIQLNKQVLQLNFAVFSRESSEGGVIVIIHDITRHERLENARRDFVADVSHELRTPLTVIKSYADILADTPDAEPELRTRFLNTISSETDRMTKIISDLLTLSKLDVDTTYVRPYEDIDIRNMIESLVDRLSLTAKKKEQELVYTPINDVPNLKGDRDGLERVFTNIITNALKYTPSGGRISIFSSKVYNDILVKVSDNGIGIPKEQLPNIFDRFYRVDKARSRDKGGTGLGLAIAKQTIETAFGGKITITSEPNKGTDVSVSIPIPKK